MLELAGIIKSYGTNRVLRGVSLCFARAEAVCLAGSNAAGKTTLLSIAAGLQKADSGRVQADGTIGFVQQENSLLPDLSVADHLALWYAAANRAEKPFSPDSAESKLGLHPMRSKRVSRLSGGMKKRVAIACALAGNPDYLLLDEPFTALDLSGRRDVMALLNRLKEQGIGILFSSHDPAAIAAVADRLVLLEEGEAGAEIMLEQQAAARTEQIIRALSHVSMQE